MEPNITFTIDTTEYAGNFEREMTAYITGEIGECEVGHDMATLYVKEVGDEEDLFGGLIAQTPDDHGCFRPTSSVASPNGDLNSVGIFFAERPSDNIIAFMMKRAKQFATKRPDETSGSWPITIIGFRLIETKVVRAELAKWAPK